MISVHCIDRIRQRSSTLLVRDCLPRLLALVRPLHLRRMGGLRIQPRHRFHSRDRLPIASWQSHWYRFVIPTTLHITCTNSNPGYVQEVLARMQHHVISDPAAQINVTLDNNTSTFPIDQKLNLDFSHDANIISILVAFGLTQFGKLLPTTHIDPDREFILSYLEPFAGRLDIEVIQTPHPVNPDRTDRAKPYLEGRPTSYVHFILNQRTIPLGKSLAACGERHDGWCEMSAFLAEQQKQIALADYEYACFGDYEVGEYGDVMDGRPVRKGE
jgi:hypothetical protein